jgi:hypothetical protein
MQPSIRYAVSVVVGVAAAAAAHVAAAPVVDGTRTWFTAILTGLVWLVAVALYLNVLCRLRSTDGCAESDASVAAKWGGFAGGVVADRLEDAVGEEPNAIAGTNSDVAGTSATDD